MENLRHNVSGWLYWAIQGIIVCACIATWTSCSELQTRVDNPWNVAHDHCSSLDATMAQRKCHLAVAIAQDACVAGVQQVSCTEQFDPSVCHTINELLTNLCTTPEPEPTSDGLESN